MSSIASVRSLLFAPGNDERKLTKALASASDAVVADLEDAVSISEKESARKLASRLLGATDSAALTMVRINGVGTESWEDDMAEMESVELDAIVLPKATPDAVEALGSVGPPVLAIIETAMGLRQAFEIASAGRVEALILGAVDLGLELGVEPREDGQELLFARSMIVLDSAAAGLRAPFDQVYVNFRDDAGLEVDCRLARSLGFRGKPCIHPAQVEIVNRLFSPSEAELEQAVRIVEAYETAQAEGRGAVALDGEMVDLPVVEKARQLLAGAERSVVHGN